MSDKEADAEELAFSERIFKNLAARADLERRTKELLREAAQMPVSKPEHGAVASYARALLAEWEARHAD